MKYEYLPKSYRIKKKDLEEDWPKIYTAYQDAIIKVFPAYFPWGTRGEAKDLLKTAKTHDGFWYEELENMLNRVGISPKSVVPGAWEYISSHVHGEARDIFFTALEAYADKYKVSL